jgi:CheY-like chemotaxis protein
VTSILIVEDDEQLRCAVTRDLSHRGFDVTAVESVEAALSRLRERGYDVLLTDLRMGERDGIDLLGALPDVAPSMPAILMSAYATARDHQRAVELGAVQVLCKPFSSTELGHAIRQALECGTGFRGSLHGVSLIDVLQMFHYARRSVCVTLGGRSGGEIHIRDGELVHAEQGDAVGEEALRRLLAMPSGSIKSGPLESDRQSIQRAFQGLVLDLLRGFDEEKKDGFLDFDDALAPATSALVKSVRPRASDPSGLCSEIVSRVEGALRCAALDLESGLVLGLHAAPGDDAEAADALVADVVQLLRGANIARIEEIIGGELAPRPSGGGSYQEARVLVGEAWRLMLTFKRGRAAVVLDTRRETSPGLAFWHLRTCLAAFEQAG